MFRRGPSAVFASLLLVAQLLFGAVSAVAVPNGTAAHCAGCPGMHAGAPEHGMAQGMVHSRQMGDCAAHCVHKGETGNRHTGCGTHCPMGGHGHCGTAGSHASPALLSVHSFTTSAAASHFDFARLAVRLPDSPQFGFLRPPTRG